MRYVIHVFILVASLYAGGVCIVSALNGESGWYGAIIAGIVFGFAAGNLTLLEIRNWVRATGHRQHSRLLRLLAAPTTHVSANRQDESLLVGPDDEAESIPGKRQALLPSREEPNDE